MSEVSSGFMVKNQLLHTELNKSVDFETQFTYLGYQFKTDESLINLMSKSSKFINIAAGCNRKHGYHEQ